MILSAGIRNRYAYKGHLVPTGCIMKGFKLPYCSRREKMILKEDLSENTQNEKQS